MATGSCPPLPTLSIRPLWNVIGEVQGNERVAFEVASAGRALVEIGRRESGHAGESTALLTAREVGMHRVAEYGASLSTSVIVLSVTKSADPSGQRCERGSSGCEPFMACARLDGGIVIGLSRY